MHKDEVDVSEDLVRRLLAEQMPELAPLPLRIVEPWGTDNAIWRLGDDYSVRLPRIAWAAGQIEREATIARAKGAAISQACAALPYYLSTYPLIVERSWHKLAELGVGKKGA
ncbi:MAG: hypothetical protein ACR2H3_10165 [Acidimicrobiales bacterium]